MKFIKNFDGLKMWIEKQGSVVWVHVKNQTLKLKAKSLDYKKSIQKAAAQTKNSSLIKAPHAGRVASILVKDNDLVEKGQPLIILSAMKMEHTLQAEKKARVKSILVKEGQAADAHQTLITFFD